MGKGVFRAVTLAAGVTLIAVAHAQAEVPQIYLEVGSVTGIRGGDGVVARVL